MKRLFRVIVCTVVLPAAISPVYSLGGPAYEWRGNPDLLLPAPCKAVKVERVAVAIHLKLPDEANTFRGYDYGRPEDYPLRGEETVTYSIVNVAKRPVRLLLAFPLGVHKAEETPVSLDGKALSFRIVPESALVQKLCAEPYQMIDRWVKQHPPLKKDFERWWQLRNSSRLEQERANLRQRITHYLTRTLGKSQQFADILINRWSGAHRSYLDRKSLRILTREISPGWVDPRDRIRQAWVGTERIADPVTGGWLPQRPHEGELPNTLLLRTEVLLQPGQRSRLVTKWQTTLLSDYARYSATVWGIVEPVNAVGFWGGFGPVEVEVRLPEGYLVQANPRAFQRARQGDEQVVRVRVDPTRQGFSLGAMHREGLQPIVFINSQRCFDPVRPRLKDGRLYIPFVGQFRWQLNWQQQQKEKSVEIRTSKRTLVLTPGSREAQLNGKPIRLGVAPFIYRDRTMLPFEALSLLSSTPPKITWSPDHRRCWIALNPSRSPSGSGPPPPPPPPGVSARFQKTLRAGVKALNAKDYPTATRALREAASLNPKGSVAVCALGRALRLSGKTDEAIEWYHKGVKQNPVLHAAIARLCHEKGDQETAVAHMQELRCVNLLARYLVLIGQPEEAEQALLKTPLEQFQDRLTLSAVQLLLGKHEQALKVLEETKTTGEPGADDLVDRLDRDLDRLFYIACLCKTAGWKDKEREAATGAVQVANQYVELLEKDSALQEDPDANPTFQTCLWGYIEARRVRGWLSFAAGDAAAAEAELRQLTGLLPDNCFVLNGLGCLLGWIGRYEEVQALVRGRCDSPLACPENMAMLGEAQFHLGRTEEALENLRQSIKLQERQEEIQVFGLREEFWEDDGFSVELSSRETPLWIMPNLPEALYLLACSLDKLGQRAEALKELDAAIRLYPGYADARAVLGRLQGASP